VARTAYKGALNLNIHFRMLFLDGVYVDHANGTAQFRWLKAPSSQELTLLAHTIAHRVGRFLERQGQLERDAENNYPASDTVDDPITPRLGHSITYRVAAGPQAGCKVCTLQSLPACAEPFDNEVARVAGFSLHVGVGPGSMKVKSWKGCVGISVTKWYRETCWSDVHALSTRRRATLLTSAGPRSRSTGSGRSHFL